MFRDEVGTNTNQMDDGNNVGQRCIRTKGIKTNLLLSKALGCFTLMGMNAATGKPVLYIRILDAQSLCVTDFKGFDNRASIPYDSSNTTEENMG